MATFQGVELYRSTSNLSARNRTWCDTNATLLYSGTLEAYSDTGLTDNTLYYYKIFAEYLDGTDTIYSDGVMVSATTQEALFGEYELLADITVSTATTSVDITGLSLTSDDEVLLVSDIVNLSGSTSIYSLFVNNNTTATNYYNQMIYANSTSVSAARVNSAQYCTVETSDSLINYSKIKLTESGYITAQSSIERRYGATDTSLQDIYGTSTFTVTSITRLTPTASVANSIGIGSRFRLYKVGDET